MSFLEYSPLYFLYVLRVCILWSCVWHQWYIIKEHTKKHVYKLCIILCCTRKNIISNICTHRGHISRVCSPCKLIPLFFVHVQFINFVLLYFIFHSVLFFNLFLLNNVSDIFQHFQFFDYSVFCPFWHFRYTHHILIFNIIVRYIINIRHAFL